MALYIAAKCASKYAAPPGGGRMTRKKAKPKVGERSETKAGMSEEENEDMWTKH